MTHFSASLGWTLLDQTPEHALAATQTEPEPTEQMDLGTIVHGVLLTGEANVELIAASDWRTKAAKEQRDAARLAGKTPLLAHKWDEVKAMVDVARKRLEAFPPPTPFVGGHAEMSLYFKLDGVECRATPDWVSADHKLIVDFKTTGVSAHPRVWGRAMFTNGCAFQAGFYLRAVKQVYGTDPEFQFVVQETFPPYALSVVALDPEALALVDQQVSEALRLWKECRDSGSWPGYPQRICYVEAPGWTQAQWFERSYYQEAPHGV